MAKAYNAPVTIQVYLGSGKKGEMLRTHILKAVPLRNSLSEFIVDLIKKAKPELFKGVHLG